VVADWRPTIAGVALDDDERPVTPTILMLLRSKHADADDDPSTQHHAE
jgi:hypothetical protein